MPGEVQVKKKADIQAPDGPQTDGMIRMPAIVDKSDQRCGTGTYPSIKHAALEANAGSDGCQTSLIQRRTSPW
jgi:hypothetical protein